MEKQEKKKTIRKKTVVEHLESLIDFYSEIATTDESLRELIVRNLKDVKRRYENECSTVRKTTKLQ